MSFGLTIKKIVISFFTCLCVILLFLQPGVVLADQSFKSLFNEALTLTKEGDFFKALEVWNTLLEIDPEDPIALSNRGNVRLALGDSEGAIADQTKSMAILPEEPDPHLNRGMAEEALKLWSKAEEDYEWILQRDSENSSALYNLGNIRLAQGQWTQANDLFQKASLASPGFVMARSGSALALYQLGLLDQSEFELRKVIRRYPMFVDARAALTALLWRKGYSGEAESHWAAASGLDSRYRQQEWLLNIRRWPPDPVKDLMAFLDLEAL